MTLSIPFKSSLSPHPLPIDIRNAKLPADETSRQYFCNFVTSKGEMIEKYYVPLAMAWAWAGHVIIIEDKISVES